MFDPKQEIEIKNFRRESGPVSILVRFPTDEEWADHSARRKVTQKRVGQQYTQLVVDSAKADLELYGKIRVADSPADLEPEEAMAVIQRISYCMISDVIAGSEQCDVTLSIPGGTVEHSLRWPTKKDSVLFGKKSASVLDGPMNSQVYRIDPRPAAKLYDKYFVSSKGYVNGSVPLLHKEAAVRAVLDEAEREAQEQVDGF